ncbi:hypothetical protein Ddc_09853 [Ditylenchus destructor]|nr:hypothetical protein Ddc_09853 [Ditylenchus destructor]
MNDFIFTKNGNKLVNHLPHKYNFAGDIAGLRGEWRCQAWKCDYSRGLGCGAILHVEERVQGPTGRRYWEAYEETPHKAACKKRMEAAACPATAPSAKNSERPIMVSLFELQQPDKVF